VTRICSRCWRAILISGQSSALDRDQSRAELDSLLSSPHHWKAAQGHQLQQRISSIEADHASQQAQRSASAEA
jgi:hypothetical protein